MNESLIKSCRRSVYAKENVLVWNTNLDGMSARNSSPDGQSFSLYTAGSPLADLLLPDEKHRHTI